MKKLLGLFLALAMLMTGVAMAEGTQPSLPKTS